MLGNFSLTERSKQRYGNDKGNVSFCIYGSNSERTTAKRSFLMLFNGPTKALLSPLLL